MTTPLNPQAGNLESPGSPESPRTTADPRILSTERKLTLQRRIRIIVAATITYNVAEALIAIIAGRSAGSAALFGFGLDSTVEVLGARSPRCGLSRSHFSLWPPGSASRHYLRW